MANYLDNYNRWLNSGKVTTVGAGYHVFEKELNA